MGFVSGAAEQPKGEGQMRSTWAIGGQEVREVVEGMIKKIWKEVKGVDLEGWFRVMPYEVAMDVVSFSLLLKMGKIPWVSERRLTA